MSASDLAELSTLRAQIDDIIERIVRAAEGYDDSDSSISGDLFAAERALVVARRSIDRAVAQLER
jgi:hypothetical protein